MWIQHSTYSSVFGEMEADSNPGVSRERPHWVITYCPKDSFSIPAELQKGHFCGCGGARRTGDEKSGMANRNQPEGFGSERKGKEKGRFRGDARARETCFLFFRERGFE